MATATEEIERAADGKFHHPCGESFTHAAWYVKHARKCDGTKPATSGRIAARDGSGPSTSSEAKKAEPRRPDPPRARSAKRARTSVPRRNTKRPKHLKKGARAETVRPNGETKTPTNETALSPATIIAALEAERAKIDAAIAAMRALA